MEQDELQGIGDSPVPYKPRRKCYKGIKVYNYKWEPIQKNIQDNIMRRIKKECNK